MLRQLKLEEGFPRNISDLGFPSRITSVDAALHFRNDRYTVFFTGRECWRYLVSPTVSHRPVSSHHAKLSCSPFSAAPPEVYSILLGTLSDLNQGSKERELHAIPIIKLLEVNL